MPRSETHQKSTILKDITIIVLSILVAIILIKTKALEGLLTRTQEMKFIGSFIAGIFFTSAFTAAPATAAFIEIGQTNSALFVAILGGFGALLGDLVIFRFMRDRISKDMYYILRSKKGRFRVLIKMKVFRFLLPFLGALVIASPLPDELGLMLLGVSKVKTRLFAPLSFFLNFLGILVIILLVKKL